MEKIHKRLQALPASQGTEIVQVSRVATRRF